MKTNVTNSNRYKQHPSQVHTDVFWSVIVKWQFIYRYTHKKPILAERPHIKEHVERKRMKNWVLQRLQKRGGNAIEEYIQKKYF